MDVFENNIIAMHDERGKQWLNDLPNIVRDIAIRYSLSCLEPVNNLSYNYVLSGFQNDLPIILKLSIDSSDLAREVATLKLFCNHGAVKVLANDINFMLLEKAMPGTSLKSYWPQNEDGAIKIAAELLDKIYQVPLPKSELFLKVADLVKIIDREVDIDVKDLTKARRLKENLINTQKDLKLLHGDFHHDNILYNRDKWMIIDPKGVIGEREYEFAYFIRNPIFELSNIDNASDIIQYRASEFAKIFHLDSRRILNWCFVQTILSQIWNIGDNLDPTNFKNLAKILNNIIND